MFPATTAGTRYPLFIPSNGTASAHAQQIGMRRTCPAGNMWPSETRRPLQTPPIPNGEADHHRAFLSPLGVVSTSVRGRT